MSSTKTKTRVKSEAKPVVTSKRTKTKWEDLKWEYITQTTYDELKAFMLSKYDMAFYKNGNTQKKIGGWANDRIKYWKSIEDEARRKAEQKAKDLAVPILRLKEDYNFLSTTVRTLIKSKIKFKKKTIQVPIPNTNMTQPEEVETNEVESIDLTPREFMELQVVLNRFMGEPEKFTKSETLTTHTVGEVLKEIGESIPGVFKGRGSAFPQSKEEKDK